jgi:hypothetical protein
MMADAGPGACRYRKGAALMVKVWWWEWWEHAVYIASRIPCRLGYHSLSCRGRGDHSPYVGRWTDRW